MEPEGIPALTGYSCEDFPTRTTQSHLLLRKERRQNGWPAIPEDLSLWSRLACQILTKSLGSIRCYSSSNPGPVKSPSNSDTTVRRSALDQEDLKPYWKSEKRPHFCRWSTILLQVFQGFTNHREKTNRVLVLSVDLSWTSLNRGTTNETFQQSEKQDSFKHILKCSASM